LGAAAPLGGVTFRAASLSEENSCARHRVAGRLHVVGIGIQRMYEMRQRLNLFIGQKRERRHVAASALDNRRDVGIAFATQLPVTQQCGRTVGALCIAAVANRAGLPKRRRGVPMAEAVSWAQVTTGKSMMARIAKICLSNIGYVGDASGVGLQFNASSVA